MGDAPDQPVRVEGENVILRPIRPDEEETVALALAGMELEVLPNGPPSRERLRARIARSGFFTDVGIWLGIETEGRLIGAIQSYVPHGRVLPEHTYEIGIVLYEAGDRRRGLGTEAIALFIEWLRGLGATRIQASTVPGNTGMRRSLAKLGFRPQARVEEVGLRWTIFVLDLV